MLLSISDLPVLHGGLLLCRWVGDAVSVTAQAQTVVKMRTDLETGEPTAVLIPDHVDILVSPLPYTHCRKAIAPWKPNIRHTPSALEGSQYCELSIWLKSVQSSRS